MVVVTSNRNKVSGQTVVELSYIMNSWKSVSLDTEDKLHSSKRLI